MTTIQFPASCTLSDVNAIVTQYEEEDGPLTAIGNDGTYTLLTFDDAGTCPVKTAVIAPNDGAGAPVVPPGAALVCQGTIFIAGAKVACAATR
ncbi:MAG TPA: hypothetical protein VHU87_06875 [Rhizomicrobium sp.]|jgi:hypothetical protein|nr:hypothetical protein [Rhizomicrobium sp.]